jgi:hypothetical protein
MEVALAIWGAALSTALAIAQGVGAILRHRTHVTVKIYSDLVDFDGRGSLFEIVVVEAVNRGSRPVQLAAIGWQEAGGHGNRHPFEHPESREHIPTIEPQGMYREKVPYEEVNGDKPKPLVGWVRLATDQVVLSKPTIV